MKRKVVVTGLGIVTAAGLDIKSFWDSVLLCRSGIKRIRRIDTSDFPVKIAAEIDNFNPAVFLIGEKIGRMDRFSQFAMVAATEALRDSGIESDREKKDRIAVIMGTSVGGIYSHEKAAEDLFTKGYKAVNPLTIPLVINNAAAFHLAMHFGFVGPSFTITTACASASNAIGESYRMIQHGYADVAVAGGADAPISPVCLAAWCKLRALSLQNDNPGSSCKPFSLNRDGLVLGEGAGVLILEEKVRAIERGASIYAEIIGYGNNNDAYHLTHPSLEQEIRAVEMALEDAGITRDEIDYISAHGTATKINDRSETLAVKRVFGERAYKIPVSSVKSMVGHTLGASGAIGLITTMLGMKYDMIPPTLNYEVPDPECDLDYVPNSPREGRINAALSNCFAFGGVNASLVVKRFLN